MRNLYFILAIVFVGCGAKVRTIDLNGAREATVFLVHLDEEANVQEIDGPLILDAAGRLNITENQPALFANTEALIVSHEALEAYTAERDLTSKGRLRFRRDAPCWQDESCRITLQPVRTGRELVAKTMPGVSLGSLVGDVPMDVVLNRTERPAWLDQVTLSVPYDLELVEKERLTPFGNVEAWAREVDDFGVRDYLPISSDQVLIASARQICLVDESMAVSEICTPGPWRIDFEQIEGEVAAQKFDRLGRKGDGTGPIFALANGPDNNYLVRFELTESGLQNFETIAAVSSTTTTFLARELAVSADGTAVVTLETNGTRENGFLELLTVAPNGDVTREVTQTNGPSSFADNKVNRARIAATNSDTYPLITGTKNTFLPYDVGSETWPDYFFLPEQGSLTVKGIALREDDGIPRVFTVHNDGLMFHHRFPMLDTNEVRLVMPEAYALECDGGVRSNEDQLRTDIRDIVVRGPHDAFIIEDGCEILLWIDPRPVSSDLPNVSMFIDQRVGQPWPTNGEMDNDGLARRALQVLGDDVWVGGGRTLKRLRRPRLCPDCN